jgi:hypothetical protein
MRNNRNSELLSLINFLIKSLIVFSCITGSIILLMPDFSSLQRLETDQNKLIALSFIQNPKALWKLSEAEESKGKLSNAVRYMELAIGLLEMHGSRGEIISKYETRMVELKNKLKQ